MFKTTKMRKFRVIFHRRAHDDVVARLHEAGVVQLKEISEVEVARKAHGEEVAELSFLLTKFREMEEFLGPPTGKPVTVRELKLDETLKLARRSLEKLEPKVMRLKKESEELEKNRQNLLAQLETIEKFRDIRLPLRYLQSTDEIKISTGYIDEERADEFLEAAKEALSQRIFTSVFGTGKRRIVIVVCRAQDQQRLSPVLYRFEVEPLELPPLLDFPSKAIKDLKRQAAEIERRQRGIGRAVRRLARSKAKEVARLRELLEVQRERLESAGLFGYTDTTTVMEGWVRAKEAPKLEKLLDVITEGHNVFRTYDPQPPEAEAVPIELENPPVIKDFEQVTEMYGLPKYDEIDPTPILTFTFALFFGVALSDAGYGIMLGAFMASGVWLSKIFPRRLRRMMVVCAIFTVIMGALTGGFFGFGSGLWVNPIQRPVPLLKLVIFIGIAHLLIAFGVAGTLKDFIRRDWKSLVFNRLSPVLIIIGFFGLSFSILGIGLHEFGINYTFPKTGLFSAFNPLEPAGTVVTISRLIFYLGLIIGMAGAAVRAKDIRGKIGGPINVLYSITGYIADVSSYTRLMALSIAGSVIAFSINLILGLIYNGIKPAELTPLSITYFTLVLIGLAFIFLAAHGFNIFISSLGCFIHTMRLHFSEFFGKFYESGGERFTPFKAKRRFTKVKGGEWPGR